tara:strand:+ start:394 stop:567 length:174 start_codon:yes stop_codon:yes gene_type:complete
MMLLALVMFVIINTASKWLTAVVWVLDIRCGTGMHKIMNLCAAVLILQVARINVGEN